MKVLMAPADEHGCGLYRMRAPAAALEDEPGVEVSFTEGFRAMRGVSSGSIRGLEEPVNADVVVLQRPLTRYLTEVIPFLQKAGAAVVVDVDDDFSCLHSRHPTYWAVHPRNPDCNWHFLKKACSMADLVTVSTPALKTRYGSAGNCVVLPNYVPDWYLDVQPKVVEMTPTVGWAGFTHSHPADLTMTRGGVAMALEQIGGKFLTIGDGEGVGKDLGIDETEVTGPVSIDKYPEAVARLDVGIVPLLPTAFNRAKSWLKGLEYAALGVPFVASMTPEYERLAEEGIGLLATDRGRDWKRQIVFAWHNREDLAQAGRQAVAKQFTYEDNGWRWAEAWAKAMHRACTRV